MIAYLLPFFLLSLLTVLEDLNRLKSLLKNIYFYCLIALFFILFIGLRIEIGCDWLSYKNMFDELSSKSFSSILINNFVSGPNNVIKELGHILITLFSRNIYVLNSIYALLFVAPLFYYCSKIKRVYLSLLISYPYYIVVVGMGTIRQAACISILMLSIFLVSKSKYIYHFFLTTFGLLIHQFSILFNCFLLIPLVPKILKVKFFRSQVMLVKEMPELFNRFFIKAISLIICLSISFTLFNSPSYAAKTSMTGDYAKDTISVVKTLQIAVDTPKDSPDKNEVRDESLVLITDYISRYRNRGMVNKTQSFTTMQTALNAMAGHYKNFASRPLPDKLKERLTKEFSLAEKMVLRES